MYPRELDFDLLDLYNAQTRTDTKQQACHP